MYTGSSLIYNMSARHELSLELSSGTRCDTRTKLATRVRHEWDTNDTSATRARNFNFDNDTSKNIFQQPYIYYMANERLHEKKQFHSKNYLLEMPHSHAKMRLKNAPQKLNFLMAKAILKSYTQGYSFKCLCTFPHSYAQ